MKILENKKGIFIKIIKPRTTISYSAKSGKCKLIKFGDSFEIEGFKPPPCNVWDSPRFCKGCIVIDDTHKPICVMYGGEYIVEEVVR